MLVVVKKFPFTNCIKHRFTEFIFCNFNYAYRVDNLAVKKVNVYY